MSEQTAGSGDHTTDPPPAKKIFAFKKSALSAKADQMWSQSKSGFGFGSTQATHVHLEKKSLDDVLGKMAAEKKERQDKQNQSLFIFGSKISDRVMKENSTNGDISKDSEKDSDKPKSAEELFKTAARTDKGHETHDFIAEAKEAAEKQKEIMIEKQLAGTSVVPVSITTGEESDKNVFQTACKLHAFDKEKKVWVEKGLAQIRVNERVEDGELHHRIVARTTGNHRVVINSKVYSDMLFERVDAKRIKISATGPESAIIQIFLITIGFSKTDLNIEEFYSTVDSIIKKEKAREVNTRKRKAEEELSAYKIDETKGQEITSLDKSEKKREGSATDRKQGDVVEREAENSKNGVGEDQ
uniref:RanBD1 domain-containing protein n=1 Tax=Heterorhabditis bacteriophora TaxID=37862 RepID=A0A1I7XB89_HETBA